VSTAVWEDDEAFLARARTALRLTPPGPADDRSNPKGDHVIDASLADPGWFERAHLAAVLVPIVLHDQGPTVLLTVRAANLRTHSGQIAFPGGRIDPGDAGPAAAALREAWEEIGLTAALAQPLGYLDGYLSGTGFFVVPVVAVLEPGFALNLNTVEVDSVFEVPLRFLMDPANHELHAREWKGHIRQYYAMPFGAHYIWGVTAGILRNLYERLHPA
jgi:8-oxo-dGTP pyrophosphatase MutT (NUDIX family)